MTALVWDKSGEHVYQTGIDRGVLYLQDGTAVVWNGLTSVEDTTSKETNSYYLDGAKYLQYISPGDFSANLKAFTYPDEFDEVNGINKAISGLRIHDQPPQSFGLSYRTMIGDDLNGLDAGYIIHLIYNVLANPDSTEYATLKDSGLDPTEFSWVLSAKPVREYDRTYFFWRPTAHFSIDSRDIDSELLQSIEDTLYGTDSSSASLPSILELFDFDELSPLPDLSITLPPEIPFETTDPIAEFTFSE